MKKIILFALFSAISFLSLAQSTEILPGNVLPSMTTTQRNALASPKEGMLVFDTTAKKYYFRRGSTWEELGSGNASAWGLSGNSVTSTDFIGTTNNVPLRFKANNQYVGYIYGSQTGIGEGSLNYGPATGAFNSAFGGGALSSITTGSFNNAMGSWALISLTTGDANSAFGDVALRNITTGGSNTGIGARALYNLTTGNFNTGLGTSANVSSGNLSNATAVGARAYVSQSNSMVLGSIKDVMVLLPAQKWV